jgi:hypothetical protein
MRQKLGKINKNDLIKSKNKLTKIFLFFVKIHY